MAPLDWNNPQFYWGVIIEKYYIKFGELNASRKESLPCVKGGGKIFDFDGGIVGDQEDNPPPDTVGSPLCTKGPWIVARSRVVGRVMR